MPNWTMNKVYVSGDPKTLTDLIHSIETRDPKVPKGERSPFDFNSIIPMPKPLTKVSRGGTVDKNGVRCTHWRTNKDGEHIAVPKSTLASWKKKFGATDWYDWATDNWGTKWNACEPVIATRNPDLVIYEFNTAWSAPWPIYTRLCEAYPELNITWESAYEEEGYSTWHKFPKQSNEVAKYEANHQEQQRLYNEFKAKMDRGDFNIEEG